MQKKITQGPTSNYEIQLTFDSIELTKAKTQAIKQFQKDMELPGFRKGFVPINIVEKNITPEYLQMGIYEELVNTGIQETLKENTQIKFIGEPYDFNQKKENQNTIITLKLDAYPEVQIIDQDRKNSPIDNIDVQVNQEEIDNAISSIQKNYADYQDANTISLDTVSKIFVEYLDQESNVLDKSNIYIGEQEFAENKFFTDNFVDKSKEQEFSISYDIQNIPTVLVNQKKDLNIQQIKFTIKDIKKIVLPELNTTTIEKLFGKESEVKTYEQLLEYIKKEITKQKYDNTLMQNIDKFLQTIQSKYMNVSIPQTLINEEFKVRLKSFEDRFGGEEKLNQYYTQIGEEKKNEMLQGIKKSSKISLEKFFILQKITEELGIDVDRQNSQNLEIEKQIYQKLSSKEQSSTKIEKTNKQNKEETNKQKKEPKAPKAKTTKSNKE